MTWLWVTAVPSAFRAFPVKFMILQVVHMPVPPNAGLSA
jgi:hypothetical protein